MKTKKVCSMFDICNTIVLAILVVVCLYPLWYVIIASFSEGTAVSVGKVSILPVGFNFKAYKQTFAMEGIGISYLNTIFYSVVGTILSIVFTVLAAYPLAKQRLRGRKIMTIMVTFTMWFSAGMIPTYLVFLNLNLLDTRTGVLLCGMIDVFNLIIMRTGFMGVPDSLEESMKLDGASDFTILTKCYVPLAIPTIMTISLYYFVARWNSYLWPMILLRDDTKIPLQVLLKKLIVEMTGLFENADNADLSTISQETVLYSTIVIAVAPMLAVYPFVQRFFVKGMTIGAVKG